MVYSYENMKNGKLKKDIKWYTYVDSRLDSKLQEFMDEYEITNQAKIIRTFVDYSIDYIKAIVEKKACYDIQNYNESELDALIRKAIEEYEIGNNFYEELKQKISPLKVSLLMLNNYIKDPDKLTEGIQNAIDALKELEDIVSRHFEEPNIVRFVRKIDILYIEDNELERRTIDHFFKLKGVEIKSVETSDEALQILKTVTPRAILLDINLKTSNINGDNFCQMLKSKPQYDSIPVILISAAVSEKERHEVLARTKADDIIFKPIDRLKELDIMFKHLKEKY
ncbi:MAG: response regulator [Candidatus Lokiarchaeota archaeon]|nr:response regulator [Candidatus Lokiarchaeota archaeon]